MTATKLLLRLGIIALVAWLTFKYLAPYKLGWIIIPLGFAWSVFASMQMRHKALKARAERRKQLAKELADL